MLKNNFTTFPVSSQVFRCLEHTNNCFIFSKSGLKYLKRLQSLFSMNQVNILKDKIVIKIKKILQPILITFNSNSLHYLILVPTCRTRETGCMTKRKVCTIMSRNTSSWVCPIDFDGRREMSSLSLKTVVVHKSVTSLMTETNLQKGRLVHQVPWTKSREKLQ